MESMRHMETLVGKTRGKGVKVQHMVNVEKVNQAFDIMTMCHTENNEAPKIFIVSSGKDISTSYLATIMYLTKAFVLPIARYYI